MKKNKQPPQIRQTLASKYRFLVSNPSLRLELERKLALKNPNVNPYLLMTPLKTLAEMLDNEEPEKFPKLTSVKPRQIQHTTKKTVFDNLNFTKRNQTAPPIPQKTVSDKLNIKKNNFISSVLSENKSEILHLKNASDKSTSNLRDSQIAVYKEIKNAIDRNATFIKDTKIWPLIPHRASEEMTSRLRKWMKSRGKNIAHYHHLLCFGIHLQTEKSNNVANKENIETPVVRNNSFTDPTKEKVVENFDFSCTVRDALLDLHELILEGYPPEACEIWLRLLKQKSKNLEDKPEYWECLAALGQSKDNINLAVDCYKTAIIKGAEIERVDKHLDQLLQKFNLLNTSKNIETKNTARSKVVKDARNIFKSSIIKFAVQERIMKMINNDSFLFEKKMVATPIKRSIRRSKSTFTSTTTPKVQIYSSLQDINSSFRSTIDLKCNSALKN